jgi:hypothetical protein
VDDSSGLDDADERSIFYTDYADKMDDLSGLDDADEIQVIRSGCLVLRCALTSFIDPVSATSKNIRV